MAAICVFCASGPVPEKYLRLAADVGTAIGASGHSLVSGGGRVSMMGAVAGAARAAGAHTTGVIPRELVDREVADVDADELIVTTTMRERKQRMDDAADAFLTLPGGVGTLEEFFESWTGEYLGMHDKPVVVLDPDGFYRPLFDWLEGLVGEGFVNPTALQRIDVVTDVDAALERCGRRWGDR